MWKVLKAYVPSIRRYVWLGVLSVVTLMLGVGLDALYPYLVRELVDGFITGSTDNLERTFQSIVWLLIATWVVWFVFDFVVALFELKVMRDLDERSFAVLQEQSMRFFEGSYVGSLIKQVTRFRSSFEGMADTMFFQVGRDCILLTVTFGIFFWERPALGWLFLGWTLLFLGLSVLIAIVKYPLDEAAAKSDSMVGGKLADTLSNAGTVKAYAQESPERERYRGAVEENYYLRLRSWMTSVCGARGLGVLMTGFQILFIGYLIKGYREGSVTPGDFVFFQSYVLWIMGNLWHFSGAVRRLFQLTADAKEMAEVFSQKPEMQDREDAVRLQMDGSQIDFEGVRFAYNGGGHHEVKDLTLSIAMGESLGLVGPSGSGKSTLVKLLLRLYGLKGGVIRISGQDIAAVTQKSLREQIAVVPQDPQLFHRSLRENIAFACPGASEEEIITAAKRARAWEFIERLPDGLDTLVGERGVKLSGGERQRIALARAFLADRPILILDEATSALDSQKEALIQEAIAELIRGRTCIVIAHRLSTIMRLHRIVVLEEGQMEEQGTHDELLQKNGLYATLWAHQSGGYLTVNGT